MDEGFVNRRTEIIQLIPLALVGLFILRGFGNFLSQYAISWVGQRIVTDIRNAIFAHLTRLPCAFYDLHPSGMLISKLLFDVGQVANAVTNAIFVVIRDGLTVLALLAWMIHLDWKLTLIFLVLAPVSAVLIRTMSRRFRKISHRIQASMGEISQVTQEATEGQRVIKAFGAEAREVAAFAAVNEMNRRENIAQDRSIGHRRADYPVHCLAGPGARDLRGAEFRHDHRRHVRVVHRCRQLHDQSGQAPDAGE